MDYYKMRAVVMNRIREHLEFRSELKAKKQTLPKFRDFEKKLMLEYGVSERMVKRMVEKLVNGGTVKDGELAGV